MNRSEFCFADPRVQLGWFLVDILPESQQQCVKSLDRNMVRINAFLPRSLQQALNRRRNREALDASPVKAVGKGIV